LNLTESDGCSRGKRDTRSGSGSHTSSAHSDPGCPDKKAHKGGTYKVKHKHRTPAEKGTSSAGFSQGDKGFDDDSPRLEGGGGRVDGIDTPAESCDADSTSAVQKADGSSGAGVADGECMEGTGSAPVEGGKSRAAEPRARARAPSTEDPVPPARAEIFSVGRAQRSLSCVSCPVDFLPDAARELPDAAPVVPAAAAAAASLPEQTVKVASADCLGKRANYYVVVSYGGVHKATSRVKSAAPRWDETFVLTGAAPLPSEKVYVQLMRKAFFRPVEVGCAHVEPLQAGFVTRDVTLFKKDATVGHVSITISSAVAPGEDTSSATQQFKGRRGRRATITIMYQGEDNVSGEHIHFENLPNPIRNFHLASELAKLQPNTAVVVTTESNFGKLKLSHIEVEAWSFKLVFQVDIGIYMGMFFALQLPRDFPLCKPMIQNRWTGFYVNYTPEKAPEKLPMRFDRSSDIVLSVNEQDGELMLLFSGKAISRTVNRQREVCGCLRVRKEAVVEALEKSPPDPNAKAPAADSLELLEMCAAITCDVAAVRRLLEAGENVNQTNKYLETPLHKAVQRGHLELVELLVEFGANPLAANQLKVTPLSLVDLTGQTDGCLLALLRRYC